MNIFQYIYELLLHHDCVIVPGFGGFISNYVTAKIHPVTHSFAPPRKEILFNSSLKHNDGVLLTHIAQKENISYEVAAQKINEFLVSSFHKLEKNETVEVFKVGTLSLDNFKNIHFVPDNESNILLSSFGLSEFTSPAIHREGIEKRIEKIFSDNKKFKSEEKTSGRFARAAMIAVPAAAMFVWAFLNVGTIKDISSNYSSLSAIFSSGKTSSEKSASIVNNPREFSPYLWTNPFRTSSPTNILENEKKLNYPFITGKTNIPEINVSEENTESINLVSINACKYYIIGSCNRIKENAESYKLRLISKGYTNAGIIEPAGSGLYKVFINCFDNEDAAIIEMEQIHHNESPEAWLLKM